MSLTVVDAVAVQLGGPQRDEEHIVIDIQFGALVRLIGVLDDQFMETQL